MTSTESPLRTIWDEDFDQQDLSTYPENRMADALFKDVDARNVITDYALERYKIHAEEAIAQGKKYNHKPYYVDWTKTDGWKVIGTDTLETFLATYEGKVLAGPIYEDIGLSQGCLSTPMIGYLFRDFNEEMYFEIWFISDSDTYDGGNTPQTIRIEIDARDRKEYLNKKFNVDPTTLPDDPYDSNLDGSSSKDEEEEEENPDSIQTLTLSQADITQALTSIFAGALSIATRRDEPVMFRASHHLKGPGDEEDEEDEEEPRESINSLVRNLAPIADSLLKRLDHESVAEIDEVDESQLPWENEEVL